MLYKAMESHFSSLDDNDKKFMYDLRTSLIDEVSNLNRNYTGVIRNIKFVEKYSNIANWMNLDNSSVKEIKERIAPNVSGDIDLESARFFDYLCYKLASSKYNKKNTFALTAKTMYTLAHYLLTAKLSNSEVKKHEETLNFIASDELLHNESVCKIDEIRLEIRDLIRYIEKVVIDPIITDFNDKISSTNDAEDDDVDFSISVDDFKTLDEKAKFYIQINKDEELVKQIVNLQKPTYLAIRKFQNEMQKLSKTVEEYNLYFGTDLKTTSFVRKNSEINPISIEEFINKEKANGFNEEQINYTKELLSFISQNGLFDRNDLLREELNFDPYFNSEEINKLICDIEEII